jgi:hypothetical protein
VTWTEDTTKDTTAPNCPHGDLNDTEEYEEQIASWTARVQELEGSLEESQTHVHFQQELLGDLETKQELADLALVDQKTETERSIQGVA